MEGQRIEQKSGGFRKGPVIAGIVVAVLIAAYLGLCAWVGASNRVMPHVSAAGVDLSGMTAEQASAAMEQAVEEYGHSATVTLRYGTWSGTLSCAQFRTGADTGADAALRVGREHFLTQGFQYLRHLLGGSSQVDIQLGAANASQPDLERLLKQADQELGGGVVQMSYQAEGDRLSVTKGVTGAVFDRERVLSIVSDAVCQSLEETAAQGQAADVQVDLAVQEAVTETPPDTPDFDAVFQDLYVEAKSAELDPESYEITDHVVGVTFDVDELARAYEAAEEGECFTIPLTLTQPKETKESLEHKLFADLLGEATSTVSGTANRKNNVKLSAAACNGIILLPGEEFSYNSTTGSRTADKGYLPAPIYVGGKSQDDTGGGICQTSSTIYYAILHTTLEVVERHDHQFAVGYVPDGMDATVFYGSLDFRFKNNTEYPIKIVTESYDSGGKRKLTVKIYGTNADGRYAVPERIQYDWVQPTTAYTADTSVPRGTLVLDTAQYAYQGRKAHTYRYIYEKDGTLVEKQDMGVSSYAMRPNLYHYNPLDGDPSTWTDGKPAQPETEPAPETTAPETTAPDPEPSPDPAAQDQESAEPAPEETAQSDAPGDSQTDSAAAD